MRSARPSAEDGYNRSGCDAGEFRDIARQRWFVAIKKTCEWRYSFTRDVSTAVTLVKVHSVPIL
jgi:hypothetical protein